MEIDQIRQQFEEWACDIFQCELDKLIEMRAIDDLGINCYIEEGNREASVTISMSFMAWQASREALMVELMESSK